MAYDQPTNDILNAAFIGRIVPNSGDLENGIGQGGQNGVPERLIEDNGILFAPRFGLTYDLTGNSSFIFRAGGGMFYDRYEGNIAFDEIVEPADDVPADDHLGPPAGCRPVNRAARAVGAERDAALGRDSDDLQLQRRASRRSSPGGMIFDIAYVGSIQNHLPRRVNVNAVPYGATFAAQNQDTTLAPSTPGGPERASRPTSCGRTPATATSTCVCSTPTPTTTGCRRRSTAGSRTASS